MISESEIEKISRLSRLRFSKEQSNYMAQQLSDIMKMIDKSHDIDTKDIIPLTSVCNEKLHMRADIVNDGNLKEKLFINAPGTRANFAREIGCFIVPKVVE